MTAKVEDPTSGVKIAYDIMKVTIGLIEKGQYDQLTQLLLSLDVTQMTTTEMTAYARGCSQRAFMIPGWSTFITRMYHECVARDRKDLMQGLMEYVQHES